MKLSRLRRLAAALMLPAAFAITQCEKNSSQGAASSGGGSASSTAASGSGSSSAASTAPAGTKASSLAEHAAKLGFAAKLNADTELYLGTVGFKGHVDALKKSAFWKEISALIGDKTPAPAAGDKSMQALQKLWGDDFFLAGGKGLEQSAQWLRDFSRLYNELNFRAIMTGAAFKGAGVGPGAAKFNPAAMVEALTSDPAQIERAANIIAALDLPPLILGVKVENAADVVKDLVPADKLAQAPKEIFTVSTLSVAGGTMNTISTTGGKIFQLDDNKKQMILSNLPPTINDKGRKAIENAISAIQAKTFSVGWGAVGDHVVFASGKNLDHVKFADSPASSLLSKPEFAPVSAHAGKNLLALVYSNAGVLKALSDDQPLTPILRGIFGAMKDNPTFGGLGQALDKQLADYAPAENAVFKRDFTPSAGVVWWDRGLHVESYGGPKAASFQNGKPLKFTSVASQPGVILSVNYQRNRDYEKATRAWMEKLLGFVMTAAQELVKSGLGGAQAGQGYAMFEQMALPALKKIYAADLNIADKGLGDEVAFVIDVNGKMPALPGVPPQLNGSKFPRITTISEVANRAEVATGWTTINGTLSETIGMFTGGPGSRDRNGAAAGGGGPGFGLPDPISSEKNGVTTWFYGLPFLAGDLLPCASINDKLLLMSTSKDCAEGFAGEIAKGNGISADGLVWRFDLGALIDFGIGLAKLDPKTSAKDQSEMKQVQKWTKPFHAMQGRLFQEGGVPRGSFSWEITDLVSFD